MTLLAFSCDSGYFYLLCQQHRYLRLCYGVATPNPSGALLDRDGRTSDYLGWFCSFLPRFKGACEGNQPLRTVLFTCISTAPQPPKGPASSPVRQLSTLVNLLLSQVGGTMAETDPAPSRAQDSLARLGEMPFLPCCRSAMP